MLLKTLRMVNFRQYKGETNISFSCDKEKNVTIILGDNTFGKTTLLQAFNWCFYKEVMLPNKEMLLNLDVASSMPNGTSVEVEVEITLMHSGVEYIITRTQEYTKKEDRVNGLIPRVKVSYRADDGQIETIKDTKVDSVINTILPKDLSGYFFFDTERVGSISERKDLNSSVKGLLGLTVLENAIKHIGSKTSRPSVIHRFYSSMDVDGDKRTQEALDRIQEAQEKREVYAQQLENVKSQINEYENRKDQLENILRDNQMTSSLQKKKDELNRNVEREIIAQNNTIKAFLRDFNDGSLSFFSQPLIRQASDFLKEAKIDDKGIIDLTKPTLEEIIKRGKCICGCELKEGSDALVHIYEEMNYVPPESIGNAVRNYRDRLENFNRSADRTFESIQERYQSLLRSKTRIQDWNDEIEDISDKISGKENMQKYELELNDIKTRLRDLNIKKERFIRDDESCKKNIEHNQKIYESLTAMSSKNKALMSYMRYAEEVLNWLSDTYKEKELYIRNQLQEEVNSIFERMYHGHRRVAIDSKYGVKLLTTIDNREVESGESEGLNRVKNFAFIAGLVAMAKNKIISKSGDAEYDLSSEPYPLVMDAPFSNADEIHTGNISKILPEVAEQVVMFVMRKDWRYAEPVISEKVGAQYTLTKISEQHTILKGV